MQKLAEENLDLIGYTKLYVFRIFKSFCQAYLRLGKEKEGLESKTETLESTWKHIMWYNQPGEIII